jgi:hypothetical protein
VFGNDVKQAIYECDCGGIVNRIVRSSVADFDELVRMPFNSNRRAAPTGCYPAETGPLPRVEPSSLGLVEALGAAGIATAIPKSPIDRL